MAGSAEQGTGTGAVVAGVLLSTLFGAFVGERMEARIGPVLGGLACALLWLFVANLTLDASRAVSRHVAAGRHRGVLSLPFGSPDIGKAVTAVSVVAVGSTGLLALGDESQAALLSFCSYTSGMGTIESVDDVVRFVQELDSLVLPFAVLVAPLAVVWISFMSTLAWEHLGEAVGEYGKVRYSGPFTTLFAYVGATFGLIFIVLVGLVIAAVTFWLAGIAFTLVLMTPVSAASGAAWAPYVAYFAFVCGVAYAFGLYMNTPTTKGFDQFGVAMVVALISPWALGAALGYPPSTCEL